MGDSLGDLAHLLLSDCQAAHGLLRVDIDAKLIEQLLDNWELYGRKKNI